MPSFAWKVTCATAERPCPPCRRVRICGAKECSSRKNFLRSASRAASTFGVAGHRIVTACHRGRLRLLAHGPAKPIPDPSRCRIGRSEENSSGVPSSIVRDVILRQEGREKLGGGGVGAGGALFSPSSHNGVHFDDYRPTSARQGPRYPHTDLPARAKAAFSPAFVADRGLGAFLPLLFGRKKKANKNPHPSVLAFFSRAA